MAEFMLKHLVAQAGRTAEFEIASAAVSAEEIGNDLYPPAKRKLREKGIPFTSHAARQVTRADYDHYDHIICMDRSNLRLLGYRVGDDSQGKVSLLMEWADIHRDVADPWYTGDFEATYSDLLQGCQAIMEQL